MVSGDCEHAGVLGRLLQVKVKRQVALPHLLFVHQVELLVHGDGEDVLPQPDSPWFRIWNQDSAIYAVI